MTFSLAAVVKRILHRTQLTDTEIDGFCREVTSRLADAEDSTEARAHIQRWSKNYGLSVRQLKKYLPKDVVKQIHP